MLDGREPAALSIADVDLREPAALSIADVGKSPLTTRIALCTVRTVKCGSVVVLDNAMYLQTI